MTDLPETEQSQAENSSSPPESVAAKCALLNDDLVFIGMVDHPGEAGLTPNHLPEVTACDLPANQYVWEPNAKTFLPLRARAAVSKMAVDAIESGIKLLQRNNTEVPLEVLIWVQQLKRAS